ncbi:hypothetical protein ACWT_1460 [Actinoplanes sp. SE50]|uniref:hypothetical protein n=1 Tax=unclassified Actinoplanes TaxID=2626549 RepID=UPI00023EC3F6|nr:MULTISPECIES: hypothetical protein [unclassified Actinoplanes]AEV82478.1 hypothetical protein ACPL_1581 [Actinoplanes sp. SE50/110]ATO80875.1 hypothetical protein ACWT_1460 [Actinoplanes sp. SE50]SLL98282.1 hypothetical protein ACSP50_1508 [Actinoplanes sp. SE50/110]
MGDDNLYPDTTKQNTHQPWLDEHTPVDVNLDGLREYAKLMGKQQTQLQDDLGRLTHLYDSPFKAWDGHVLGEAANIRQQLTNNAGELQAYMGYLAQAFYNIGSAAQTIADIYSDGDATGAASLNDVLFAFGDKSIPRPHGLPRNIGRTYLDAVTEQAKSDPVAIPGETSPEWGNPTVTTLSPYQSKEVSVGPGGQHMEKVITSVPGSGVTIETVTIFNAKGQQLSTKSTRTTTSFDASTHSIVTSTESSQDGRATGSSVNTKTYAGTRLADETTVNKGANGQETTTTETKTATDGSKVETTTKPVKDKHGHIVPDQRTTTDEVHTGTATTSSGTSAPTTKISTAYDPIAQRMAADHG